MVHSGVVDEEFVLRGTQQMLVEDLRLVQQRLDPFLPTHWDQYPDGVADS